MMLSLKETDRFTYSKSHQQSLGKSCLPEIYFWLVETDWSAAVVLFVVCQLLLVSPWCLRSLLLLISWMVVCASSCLHLFQ